MALRREATTIGRARRMSWRGSKLGRRSGSEPRRSIRPGSSWDPSDLGEIWRYRELVYFLAWRDVKVRYKQTVLGALWAMLQPLLTMVVFSTIFGHLVGVPSDGLPYPVFAYIGLLPWTFFASALTRAGGSLVYDANLISKVYFPRLVVPIAAVLAVLVDFGFAFLVLMGMMLYYGLYPGIAALTLPLFLLLGFLTALGAGFWLSALNVKYRDVTHVMPFLVQIWLFVTPIVYPSSIIPEHLRLLYGLNPMAGVIEGFRWCLSGTEGTPDTMILVSATVAVAVFIGGLSYFRRVEDELVDVI